MRCFCLGELIGFCQLFAFMQSCTRFFPIFRMDLKLFIYTIKQEIYFLYKFFLINIQNEYLISYIKINITQEQQYGSYFQRILTLHWNITIFRHKHPFGCANRDNAFSIVTQQYEIKNYSVIFILLKIRKILKVKYCLLKMNDYKQKTKVCNFKRWKLEKLIKKEQINRRKKNYIS